ncbi:MAG TPA: hypothetical protein VHR47_10135 [Bacillota bacterium]|nr:hypothetical protein [Bacillota bacterium]
MKSNADHLKERPGGPTPNQVPRYLTAAIDRDSVIFTVEPEWTQNPPDYIFNYGHYCCFRPHPPRHVLAAHAYLVAHSFDGNRQVEFNCYGNVTPDYHPEEWVDIAGTYLGSSDQMRLARAICCFDPDDSRKVYNLRPFNEDVFKPVGPLRLGDCSGIIFGAAGVCHHMANRIAAAVTDLDAGGMAAMPGYNLANFIWGTYGGLPPVIGAEWSKLKPLTQRLFAEVYPVELEEKTLEISELAPYPVNLLYRPWEEYFAECKKVALG